MEQKDKDALRRNRTKLVNFFATNQRIFDYVCDKLLEERILSPEMLANIKSQSNEYNRSRCFLDILPRRGPEAMTAFLSALDPVPGATEIINAVRTTTRSTSCVENPSRRVNAANLVRDMDEQSPSYTTTLEDPPPTYEQVCMEMAIERSQQQQESRVPGDLLSKYVITSRDCIEISGNIGMRWEMLAVNLGLRFDVVERIKMDNMGNCRKAIQCMLEAWRALPGGGIASDLVKANEDLYAFDGYEIKTYLKSRAEEA